MEPLLRPGNQRRIAIVGERRGGFGRKRRRAEDRLSLSGIGRLPDRIQKHPRPRTSVRGAKFDAQTLRNRSVETWKNSANAFACILLMGRRPLIASDALPLDPNRCTMSFCFKSRASIKCCSISCGGAGSIG